VLQCLNIDAWRVVEGERVEGEGERSYRSTGVGLTTPIAGGASPSLEIVGVSEPLRFSAISSMLDERDGDDDDDDELHSRSCWCPCPSAAAAAACAAWRCGEKEWPDRNSSMSDAECVRGSSDASGSSAEPGPVKKQNLTNEERW
jgi:hypothetical protein